MKATVSAHLDRLISDNEKLSGMREDIASAFSIIAASYEAGGKLLLCGNGGSACDAEHISGELLKGFLLQRKLTAAQSASLCALGADGQLLSTHLQRALPAIVLSNHPAVTTAFVNDVHPLMGFAQQAWAYAQPGDVLFAISTSGNAQNVAYAATAARAAGCRVIGLTGQHGGRLRELSDVCLRAPETQTYRVQEMHLPIYHTLCMMLEEHFFGEDE